MVWLWWAGGVGGFVVDGAEVAVVAVAAVGVVPGLDPLEQGEREVLAGVPGVLVEELSLQPGEERFGDRVVEAVPTVPMEPSSAEPAAGQPTRVLTGLNQSLSE